MSKHNEWTLKNVRKAALSGNIYYLCLRAVQGNLHVRRVVSLVLDEGHLSPAQLKELGDRVETWLQRKREVAELIESFRG